MSSKIRGDIREQWSVKTCPAMLHTRSASAADPPTHSWMGWVTCRLGRHRCRLPLVGFLSSLFNHLKLRDWLVQCILTRLKIKLPWCNRLGFVTRQILLMVLLNFDHSPDKIFIRVILISYFKFIWFNPVNRDRVAWMLRLLNKVITNDAHSNNLLAIAKIISSFPINI